jgi:lysophospholipase L1-like esterase
MLAGIALAIAATELGLRVLGLHTPVLYERTSYGYRVRPSQEVVRFGNRIAYNEFGMRSPPAARAPAQGTLRVLCIGDSVTNGGALIDQDDTWPAQLERLLRARRGAVEVLNASAPGWATGNESGWLAESGIFGAALVVLEIGTHDLFQPLAGQQVVDAHPSFPSHRPWFAAEDALTHYVLPWLGLSPALNDPGIGGQLTEPGAPEPAIANVLRMAERARGAGADFVVLYLDEDGLLPPSAAAQARLRLAAALKTAAIRVVDMHDTLRRLGPQAIYRDGIHPTAAGNRAIAETLERALSKFYPWMTRGNGPARRDS